MEAFGLVEKEYASIKGVAMEPFVFSGSRTFTLFRDTQLTQRTRWERGGDHCHPHRWSHALTLAMLTAEEGHWFVDEWCGPTGNFKMKW